MDSDKDGFINSVDLRKYASLVGLASADVEDMIQEADRDGDGKINKEEFISIMKQTNLFVRSR